MKRLLRTATLAALVLQGSTALHAQKRVVVIKVDGLPEDTIEQRLNELPWIRRVFVEQGAWVRNFYVRGISLSRPRRVSLDSYHYRQPDGHSIARPNGSQSLESSIG